MADITWSRVVMNEDITRIVDDIARNADKLSILEISGQRWSVTGENTKYKRLNWPEFDICENKLDEMFDLIIAELVFEHLKYPYRAGKNVYDMIADNGSFLISVPFLFPIHEHPIDCTRWSAQGLKYFLNECGFPLKYIYTNSWGNLECLIEICKSENSIALYKSGNQLKNEKQYPISVWGLAKKSR